MLNVISPGLQSSLQGAPRLGGRHFGIPYAGPADAVSFALANRLVGNKSNATGLEITFGGFEAICTAPCSIALTGAPVNASVSGQTVTLHQTLHLKHGDHIQLKPTVTGCRTYLAIRTGFQAREAFGSTSTYLPAGFGGHFGRALKTGDALIAEGDPSFAQTLSTPDKVKPVFTNAFAVRACRSSETDLLSASDQTELFKHTFIIGRQATRMGLTLTGHSFTPKSSGLMKSAPVFPGTIQCPPSGNPIALLSDAQTTGGYPRIAHVARCDRHLLGQARPGDRLTLLHRTPEAALEDFRQKQMLLDAWLEP